MNESIKERSKGLPSASSWYRYELCAGSYQLSLQAKAQGQEAHSAPTPESEKGERIHDAQARDNSAGLNESEQMTVALLNAHEKAQKIRLFSDATLEVYNELRLWLNPLAPGTGLSGRVDRLYISGDMALVIDWKTGFSPVDAAESNSQLKVLAVLAAVNFPQLRQIYTQIISSAFGVSEKLYELADLQEAYRDIILTLQRITNERAPLIPSEKACRYCPAINICSAVRDSVPEIIGLHYYTLPDGEDAARLLDKCDILEDYLNEIRDYYAHRMAQDASYEIPGYGMISGPPKRAVTDWIEARKRLESVIPPEKLAPHLNFSIPLAEELLGKVTGLRGPRLKEKLAEVLGDCLLLKESAPSLKRVNGKPRITEKISL